MSNWRLSGCRSHPTGVRVKINRGSDFCERLRIIQACLDRSKLVFKFLRGLKILKFDTLPLRPVPGSLPLHQLEEMGQLIQQNQRGNTAETGAFQQVEFIRGILLPYRFQ